MQVTLKNWLKISNFQFRREYYLNEQMKAIQKELGDSEDGKNELDEINDLINFLKALSDYDFIEYPLLF